MFGGCEHKDAAKNGPSSSKSIFDWYHQRLTQSQWVKRAKLFMEPPVNGDSYEFNLNHIWSHSTSELASFLYQTSGNFTGSARVESLEKSKVALVAYPAVNIAWQDQESANAKSLFVGCQGAQGAPLLPSCKSLSIFAARPKYYGVHNAHCTAHPLKLHTWDILENGQAKRSKVSRCSFVSSKLLSCS